MAKKKSPAHSPFSSSPSSPSEPIQLDPFVFSSTVSSLSAPSEKDTTGVTGNGDDLALPLPTVKVNKDSLGEMKAGLDEVVRKILSSPPHTYTPTPSSPPSNTKLLLGYSAVIVAGTTMWWGWKEGWTERGKGGTGVGVVAYFLLALLQFLHAYYIEKEKIFVGKKKSLSVGGRIETETLIVSSSITPSSTSTSRTPLPAPTPTSPNANANPPTEPYYTPPLYHLSFAYHHSTNASRTLLRERKLEMEIGFGELIAAGDGGGRLKSGEGEVEEGRVGEWVGWGLRGVVGGAGKGQGEGK